MLLRWHHPRRSRSRRRSLLSALHLALLAALVLLCAQEALLPYDNPVRLSVRFNAHRAYASLVEPLLARAGGRDRWLWDREGPPPFPLDWARGDVGVVLKTGYGTRERAVAWLEALPAAVFCDEQHGGGSIGIGVGEDGYGVGSSSVEENVVVVADFEGEVRIPRRRRQQQQQQQQEQEQEIPRTLQDRDDDDALVLKVHDVVAEVLRSEEGFSSAPRGVKYRTLSATIAAGEEELARNLSGSFGWELDAMKVRYLMSRTGKNPPFSSMQCVPSHLLAHLLQYVTNQK